MKDHRLVSFLAAAAFLLALFMFVVSVVSGVNQQYFEGFHPPDELGTALQNGDAPLRIILTADQLFVAAYWMLGIFLAKALWNEHTRLVVTLSAACISVTAVLDIVENYQMLTALEAVRTGTRLELDMTMSHAVSSAVKWHFAYFAFLFLGLAYPGKYSSDRLARFLMRYIQFPLGILVYTIPSSPLLVTAHIGRLILVLALLALFFRSAQLWKAEATG